MPFNLHRFLYVLAIFAASIDDASASGWNDYELAIDPEYKIFRCNSLDVCLGRNDRSLIYVPGNHAHTGPIAGYYVTPSHILFRTLGRSPRNLFDGDTFEDVDPSKQYFFILDKSNDQLAGPHSLADFRAHPAVKNYGDIEWTEPRNPNVATPLIGALMFLALSAIILGWPLLLAIGIISVVLLIVRSRRRPQAYEA